MYRDTKIARHAQHVLRGLSAEHGGSCLGSAVVLTLLQQASFWQCKCDTVIGRSVILCTALAAAAMRVFNDMWSGDIASSMYCLSCTAYFILLYRTLLYCPQGILQGLELYSIYQIGVEFTRALRDGVKQLLRQCKLPEVCVGLSGCLHCATPKGVAEMAAVWDCIQNCFCLFLLYSVRLIGLAIRVQ